MIVTHPEDGARLVCGLPMRGRGDLVLQLGGEPDLRDPPNAGACLESGNRLRVRISDPLKQRVAGLRRLSRKPG
ncbi:hypothetical protein ACH35V_02585 [Actinomadura sp. 1N219]|uniref:hypothetical protein n=1 Tax=Actinomadura sp. 1N219 TaxID=3375152 RepID=UPI0037904D07